MSHFSIQKRNSRNSRIPAHNLSILYLQQYHTSSQYFHSRPQAQVFHWRWYLCLCCGFEVKTEELKVEECVVWDSKLNRELLLCTRKYFHTTNVRESVQFWHFFDYCKVTSFNTSYPFRSTCRLFQITYEWDFWSLYTVTFWEKVDFLISNAC